MKETEEEARLRREEEAKLYCPSQLVEKRQGYIDTFVQGAEYGEEREQQAIVDLLLNKIDGWWCKKDDPTATVICMHCQIVSWVIDIQDNVHRKKSK